MKTQPKKTQKTYRLVLSAIMVAMATVLSILTPIQLPFGGSVTLFSMVPILVIAWLYGAGWGMVTGLAYGLIQMMLGFQNFGYVSGLPAYLVLILADYILPFSMLGLAGIWKGKIEKNGVAFGLGGLMVCLIRYLCHIISGVTIWSSWADGNTWKAILTYSVTYNGSYMIPETIITVLGCVLVASFLLPRLTEDGRIAHSKK